MILASKPVFGSVTMADTVLTVAVTAMPLELTVTSVLPAASVVIAINVKSEVGPMVVEMPGVSVSVAEPSVIELPGATPGTTFIASDVLLLGELGPWVRPGAASDSTVVGDEG